METKNENNPSVILERLSIIEKAQILAWYTEMNFFAPGILVHVDKSGNGTELYYYAGADINDVYVYPASGSYAPMHTDTLSHWGGGNTPVIEKDVYSEGLEALLDDGLRATGIDRDNPVVQRYYPNNPDSVTFTGNSNTK